MCLNAASKLFHIAAGLYKESHNYYQYWVSLGIGLRHNWA